MDSLERRVGRGKVIKQGDDLFYQGTMPYDDDSQKNGGTDVVVMRQADYAMFLRGNIAMIFEHSAPMSIDFCSNFPDPIEFFASGRNSDNEPVKLWLDRSIYTNDPSKMMVFVYKTVDEAVDEGEFENG